MCIHLFRTEASRGIRQFNQNQAFW